MHGMQRYLIKLWGKNEWARIDEKRAHKHRTNNIRRTARNIFLLDADVDLIQYQTDEYSEPTTIRREEINLQVVEVTGEGEETPLDRVLNINKNHQGLQRKFSNS